MNYSGLVEIMQNHKSDADLLAACHKGRQDAWHALVERYSRLVISVPIRYGLERSDAEDVMQTVFLRMYRSFEKIREPKALPAWLLTTSHRETWRLSHSKKITTALDDAGGSVSDPPEESLMLWEQQHKVREALEMLGGECRKLLEMLFLSKKNTSYREISVALDIPIGRIGPTRARCFTKLLPILDSLGISSRLC